MDGRIGNKFWQLRSKHGRDKIFSSGDMIMEACDEYMTSLYDNPLKEHDFVGKDAKEVEKNKKHVPTWGGFATFCGVHSDYFKQIQTDYKNEKDEIKKDIYHAVSRVNDIFFHDKFAAASAGLANPSLIGKDLQIVERHDHTTGGEKLATTPSVIQIEIVRPDDDDE
jgi:hypothetical protein